MTIQDLKYITPLDIQAAYLNITSSEMYAEAKEFNKHMYDMQRKRWRFLRDFWLVVALNVIIFGICLPTALSDTTSFIFKATGGSGPVGMATGGNIPLTYLPALIYLAAFLYFIVIKKIYNWRLMLVISLIPLPTHYAFLILAIFNVILVKKMNDVDNEIKDEVGYPHFVQLVLSYIRDEENAEEGAMESFSDSEKSDDLESERKENPFDKYRTRWGEREGSMLADNDISNVINENDLAKE
ncbi:MAG: hypothetical protein J6Y71_03925 [Ruminococcus sp.]|nr:hypothetical protein [Ruminococcus sp.]